MTLRAVIVSECIDQPPIAAWLRELGFDWPETRRAPRLGFGGKTYDLAVLIAEQPGPREVDHVRALRLFGTLTRRFPIMAIARRIEPDFLRAAKRAGLETALRTPVIKDVFADRVRAHLGRLAYERARGADFLPRLAHA